MSMCLILFNEAFNKYTLWSQHLILYTRDAIRRLLTHTGFVDITVKGVQRYPLSNHLHWMNRGAPGGNQSSLSVIDSERLNLAYQASLASIDATDTLVAITLKK